MNKNQLAEEYAKENHVTGTFMFSDAKLAYLVGWAARGRADTEKIIHDHCDKIFDIIHVNSEQIQKSIQTLDK